MRSAGQLSHQRLKEACEKVGYDFATITRNTDESTYSPDNAGFLGYGDQSGSKQGTLKTYRGYPHGMATIHADEINTDILGFICGEQIGERAEAAPALVAEPIPAE